MMTTNYIDQHVGARLRYLRQSRGMSLDALAKSSTLSAELLQELEDGRTRISADLMRKLALALRAAPADFFDGFSVTGEGVVRLSDDHALAADEEARLVRDFARIRDTGARQLVLALVSSYAAFAKMAQG